MTERYEEREKLIDLIVSAGIACFGSDKPYAEVYADFLLANGVIVPPMGVGQTCFEPSSWRDEIDECRVSSITQKADGSFKIRITNLHYKGVHEITVDKIGKTVFLTKDDAVKALAERSEGK